MKKLVLIGVVGALLSSSAFAHHSKSRSKSFDGVRIGAGYALAGMEFDSFDDSVDGVKAELGYDFDKIFGVALSYEQTGGKLKNDSGTLNLDNTVIRFGTDIGYAFHLKKSFIKPYVKLGVQSFETEADDEDEDELISEIGVYYGVGLRLHYKNFYSDLSIDRSQVALASDFGGEDVDVTETTLTLGYKF